MAKSFIRSPWSALRERFAGLRSLVLLVTDPETFVERKVNSPNVRWEIVVTTLVGFASAAGVYYVSALVERTVGSEELRFAVTGKVLRPFLVAFALWIGYAFVCHFLANRVRGRGPPGPVIKGTAWALVPMGVGNLVQTVAMVVVYSGMDVSSVMTGTGPREELQSVLDAGLREPVVVGAMVVFLVTVLWSGYLMTFVVQHAKGLEQRTAVKVVAVPVGVQVLFLALGLVEGAINFSMVL